MSSTKLQLQKEVFYSLLGLGFGDFARTHSAAPCRPKKRCWAFLSVLWAFLSPHGCPTRIGAYDTMPVRLPLTLTSTPTLPPTPTPTPTLTRTRTRTLTLTYNTPTDSHFSHHITRPYHPPNHPPTH